MNVAICSLGCAKNLVDSERIMAILKAQGYDFTADFASADIIIVNTCGFIASAKEESIDAIIQYAKMKEGCCRCLVVTGCMVKKYQQELQAEIPEVDLWLTSLNFETIGSRLQELLPEKTSGDVCCEHRRILTTPSHWAYLKIAEGCNNRCTFCTIPQMRGPYVSRSIEDILEEAKELLRSGVKEVNLLAQDTTAYGKDLYGESKLKELLCALSDLNFLRIRILYSYPDRIDRELVELMNRRGNICNYLDIPMQHVSDTVLKAMGRPERRSKLEALLTMIREVNPEFALRSTFIVGFPGEAEDDFEELCEFLKEAKLDWVGAFPYSREDHTVAYDLPHQIPEEIKLNRYDTVMSLLSHYSAETLKRWVGRKEIVLIDGMTDPSEPMAEDYPYYGRCSFQAPEVDGVIYLHGNAGHSIGEAVEVEIIGSDVYDLTGKILEN